jgi:N-acetylmuramoyl-L-alanine amidase
MNKLLRFGITLLSDRKYRKEITAMYERGTKILTALAAVFLILFVCDTSKLMPQKNNHTEETEWKQEIGTESEKTESGTATEAEEKEEQETKEETETKAQKKTKQKNVWEAPSVVQGNAPAQIKKKTVSRSMTLSASQERIVLEETVIRTRLPELTQDEYEMMCRIVQAEAGGEDALGKQMVADVIINRVKSKRFPNTVQGVIFQKNGSGAQFSPISDGRYYRVTVSEETKAAVTEALSGSDATNGSLYFINAKKADAGNVTWFEKNLSLQTEHGGHRFYK